MDLKRFQTLLVSALAGLAGVVAGTQIPASETVSDNDRPLTYKGDTAVAHNASLRKTALDDGGSAVTLEAYGLVRDTDDGGVHDLGGFKCTVSEAEQARLVVVMSTAGMRRCAQGDSGIPIGQLDIHAVDLRRRIVFLGDGGAEVDSLMDVYGNRVRDSGTTYPPFGTCSMPDAGERILDGIALDCFRKGARLGRAP